MRNPSQSPTEIYSKEGCPYSRALKRKLARDKTPYVEHDVERDTAAFRQMLDLNGGRPLVPTIVVDGEVLVGFHGT
jgi:glutaredoxin